MNDYLTNELQELATKRRLLKDLTVYAQDIPFTSPTDYYYFFGKLYVLRVLNIDTLKEDESLQGPAIENELLDKIVKDNLDKLI